MCMINRQWRGALESVGEKKMVWCESGFTLVKLIISNEVRARARREKKGKLVAVVIYNSGCKSWSLTLLSKNPTRLLEWSIAVRSCKFQNGPVSIVWRTGR